MTEIDGMVFECCVCNNLYPQIFQAEMCCIKLRAWFQCEYCEETWAIFYELRNHLINGKCPKELEGNE